MKIKTAELTGAALDWAVAKCEGKIYGYKHQLVDDCREVIPYNPATDWSQGGQIIEDEGINLSAHYKIHTGEWQAWCEHGPSAYGPTPLIAAMRCYVASKLGEEIDVPDELCK